MRKIIILVMSLLICTVSLADNMFNNGGIFNKGIWTTVGSNIYYNIGNVGIGSVSPGQRLDVHGTVRAIAFIGDGSRLTGISSISGLTANYITKASTPTTIVNSQIYENGTNIGIGTTDPQGTLHVVGPMLLEGTPTPRFFAKGNDANSFVFNRYAGQESYDMSWGENSDTGNYAFRGTGNKLKLPGGGLQFPDSTIQTTAASAPHNSAGAEGTIQVSDGANGFTGDSQAIYNPGIQFQLGAVAATGTCAGSGGPCSGTAQYDCHQYDSDPSACNGDGHCEYIDTTCELNAVGQDCSVMDEGQCSDYQCNPGWYTCVDYDYTDQTTCEINSTCTWTPVAAINGFQYDVSTHIATFNDGSVGIGLDNPSHLLDVNGTGNFSGALTASNLSGTNTGNQTITLTSDVTGSGTGSFAATLSATYKGWTHATGKETLTTSTDNVGIGSSSPGQVLDVTGTIRSSLGLIVSGGNVGIGSATPGTKLDVAGSMRMIGTGAGGFRIQTGANTACTTTCTTGKALMGFDTGTIGVALPHIVSPSDATADECLCGS